jgi:hypothetical protein
MRQSGFRLITSAKEFGKAFTQRRPYDPMQFVSCWNGSSQRCKRQLTSLYDSRPGIDQSAIQIDQERGQSSYPSSFRAPASPDAATPSHPAIINTPPAGAAIGNSRVSR